MSGLFLIDTGGDAQGFISPEFLTMLEDDVPVARTPSPGQSDLWTAIVPMLRIGGEAIAVENARLQVWNLDAINQFSGDLPIVGMLMMELFDGLQIEINGPGQTVHVRPADQAVVPPDAIILAQPTGSTRSALNPGVRGGGSSSLETNPLRPWGMMDVGRLRVPVLLDTCSFWPFTLPSYVADAAGVAVDVRGETSTQVQFGEPVVATHYGLIDTVRFGEMTVTDVGTVILPGGGRDRREIAVVGSYLLRHLRLLHNTVTGETALVGPTRLDHVVADEVAIQRAGELLRALDDDAP